MRVIADENIPVDFIKILRDRGFDIISLPKRAKDIDIAKIAQKERRIIFTQDKDFANRLLFPPENFHGIIRFKIHPPVISDMVSALDNLCANLSLVNLDKKLAIVDRDGFLIK